MNQGIFNNIPEELKAMILQVLEINQYDSTAIMSTWVNEMTLENVKGALAVVGFGSEVYTAVLNLPVVVMPIYGKILNLGDVMQLITVISEIPSAQFALKDNILFLTLCLPLRSFEEENLPAIFHSLLQGADEVRTDLLAAIRSYYQIKPLEEWEYPDPVLPNIKMTPKEMQIIYSVLSRCNGEVQQIFTYLMDKWAKAGYLVATTPSSIVLDVPYGDRAARFAVLLPGISEGLAALQPAGYASLPVIVIAWEGLRKYQGFPSDSVDNYQKTINKIAALHITEASAHIDMNEKFSMTGAKALLKGMKILAQSLQPERVEKLKTLVPVTPDNIEITLASCSEHVQAVYRKLMETWRAAGGTVQCSRPGRIYLRMKTKAHRSGKFAQIPRKFNLAVLAGPRGRNSANMQIEWNLSRSAYSAYLDCIPDEVARFETMIASLPGFERKGTITYLWMDEKFQLSHAQLLDKAITNLKNAEQNAL